MLKFTEKMGEWRALRYYRRVVAVFDDTTAPAFVTKGGLLCFNAVALLLPLQRLQAVAV